MSCKLLLGLTLALQNLCDAVLLPNLHVLPKHLSAKGHIDPPRASGHAHRNNLSDYSTVHSMETSEHGRVGRHMVLRRIMKRRPVG